MVSPKILSMDKTVIEELKTVASPEENPYIFSKGNGQRKDFRRRFAKALEKRGIKHCTFHTLRHTFTGHLVMSGVGLATVRELMRHQTYEMTLRYAYLSPGHKAEAVRKFEKRFKWATMGI